MPSLERSRAARVGHETLAILEAGEYRTDAGVVHIGEALGDCVRATREVAPMAPVAPPPTYAAAARVSVSAASTLDVAGEHAGRGLTVGALNFADSTHPGGGFLEGARAQEESLVRSSALYACLVGRRFYAHHRAHGDALASDWAVVSPDVPVFRAEEGALLAAPYPCTFLTCAAPRRANLPDDRAQEIEAAFRLRVLRVLSIAAAHPRDVWVFGAWGCGAFGNSAERVASWFAEGLLGPFARAFKQVVFAIVDTSTEGEILGPFARRFGAETA